MEEVVESLQTNEHHQRTADGEDIHSPSTGKTDGCCHPQTCCRSQSTDHILRLTEDDGTGTYETDTADHLGSDT